MESTERLVRTWMASGRNEEVDEIVSEIIQDRTTLVNVTKALGEYLTAEDHDLLRKGVELLSLVLGQCPPQKLNRHTARVLTTFYCQKLNDSETIIPSLKGLVTLVALPSFTSLDVANVIQALFRHVKMKVLVHSARFHVYNIIDIVMARHRDALKAMGKEFVAGYIYLADGEKDPRNLVVTFAITRVILIEFDISEHVESMFGITFCYFPITFRPPPNDPYGITTDDLRAALLGCLNATPNFGPLAIPVFLEKLTTGARPTKRDALQAMASCLPVYGAALARVTARKLWNALKLEIFQPTDSDMEQEALKTMQILVQTIYAEEEQALESDEDIQGLARDACEECLQILKEPEKSQAKPATKILCAFVNTTPPVSRFIISQAVPHLIKLFHNLDEISNRPPVLLLLTDFITASRELMQKDKNSGYETLLLPYKDEVLGVLTIGLKHSSSCVPALLGLQGIVNTKKLLSDEELGFVVLNVNETLQGSLNARNDSSDAVLNLLSEIARLAPRHVEEQTLPLLFSALPDLPPARDAADERHKLWQVLSILKTLCTQAELFEIFIIRLTTKLDLICVPSAGLVETRHSSEPRAAYAHSILKTISQTLRVKVDKAHPDVSKYVDRLVPRLYSLFIYSALVGDDQNMVATDPRLVEAAGEIITLVIQSLTAKRQETFVIALFEAFIKCNITGIAIGNHKMPPDKVFAPLDSSSSSMQKHSIALFSAGIVPLYKEVQLPVKDVNQFLQIVLTWGLCQADGDLNRDSVLHLLAVIVNKQVDDISLFLNKQLDSFWNQEIAESTNSIERRQKAIKAWIWISKALLVRNHPLSLRFATKPFEAFGDMAVNWDAAKALGEIASVDNVFTKQNHTVTKFLYVQKFVNTVLPLIVAGARDATKPNEQTASLVALTALIRAVPKAAYIHELPSLLPLLLRGLDFPESSIRGNVIDTFLAAAEGDSPETSVVAEHASTLVASMLKNSLVVNMPSMRVRVAALQYLAILPTIVRYDVLHPRRSTVLRELAKALDDPKREVRKRAVDARTNWFKYNG